MTLTLTQAIEIIRNHGFKCTVAEGQLLGLSPTLDTTTGVFIDEWEEIDHISKSGEVEGRKVASWLGY